MISLRHLSIAIITFGLIAALVFLYNKTEAVNLGERNSVVALLGELQEIEGRWDIDVLRMRTEMDTGRYLAGPCFRSQERAQGFEKCHAARQ